MNEREKQEMKQKNIAYQSQHRSQLNEHTKEAIKTKDAAYQSQHRSQLNEHTKEAIKTKDAAAHAKRRRALVTSQMNVKRRKRSHADVDFDSAAYDILQLVHDLSGHTISSNAAFNKSDEGLIRDDIQLHAFISDMQKSKLIKDFQAAMPLDKPLFACASCGIRDVMQQYTSWEIAKLPAAFKLTSVQVEKMSNTSKIVLFKADGSTYLADLSKIFTTYKLGNELYHLYPDLVDPQSASVLLCESCHAFCKSKKAKHAFPPYSVAAGYDYGNFSAIGMHEQLTEVEKCLLAEARLYGVVVKVAASSNSSSSADASRSVLNGHVITFLHEGPQRAMQHFNEDSVNDITSSFKVCYEWSLKMCPCFIVLFAEFVVKRHVLAYA